MALIGGLGLSLPQGKANSAAALMPSARILAWECTSTPQGTPGNGVDRLPEGAHRVRVAHLGPVETDGPPLMPGLRGA
eukprot:494223-Lingulodinium_polyedra.AAC.1